MNLKWDFLGTLFGIVGAVIIASNIGINGIGFFIFLLSSFCYLKFGYDIKNKNLITLNAVYVIVNIIGIINYI